jgi:protein transport protein SEC61 subunit alpha
MLDEMMKKGYGIGYGIYIFIEKNICEKIVWKEFSNENVKNGSGKEFEGDVIELLNLLEKRKEKVREISEEFYRKNMNNMMNLMDKVIVFEIVI